jgi:hypothetical protein
MLKATRKQTGIGASSFILIVLCGRRRQGDKETGRQGDKETGRQGDKESLIFPPLLVSPSPPLLVLFLLG